MQLQGCWVLNENFEKEKKNVYIKDGKLTFSKIDGDVLDLTGLTVIPGFIDIHMHGFMGYNPSFATYDELNSMCSELIKVGVTGITPTTTTLPKDALVNALKTISHAMENGTDGAEILGIYMEGPYLSQTFKGAMRPGDLRSFSKSEFDEFLKAADKKIKIMTLAPEIKENFDGIKVLLKNGVVPSIGHTDANASKIEEAISEGMSNATHLFNAMRGLAHREPGVVGGILDSGITAELICDGEHINEKVIRIAYKVLGADRLILISDTMPYAGMPDGNYDFDGQECIIKDGTCRLPNGTLNGNINSLFECVKRCVQRFGIPFEDAVKCASYNPAKRLGVEDRKGSIAEGKDADLVVIDDDFNIRFVIKNGIIVCSY